MDRKEFIRKSAGLIMIGGFSVMALAAQQAEPQKLYTVISKRCDGCGHCFRACKDHALTPTNERKAVIDPQKCTGCGECTRFCRRMAIVELESDKQG
jgi:ferredoxin